jgi:hypothetical protein
VIYRELLEDDFEKLPPVLSAFRSAPGIRCATGTLWVRGDIPFLACVVGFPPEGEQVPVTLEVRAIEDQQTWTRSFSGLLRRTTQRAMGGLVRGGGQGRFGSAFSFAPLHTALISNRGRHTSGACRSPAG